MRAGDAYTHLQSNGYVTHRTVLTPEGTETTQCGY